MFGEFNDLDICGINRGGGFDDPSDDTNYSFDAQSDASASISDDYIDTFDSESSVKEEPVAPKQPKEQVPETTEEVQAPDGEQSELYQAKKSTSSVYLMALILLMVVAGGLFYYKKNVQVANVPSGGQEMGDYFYDKAMEQAPEQAQQPEQAAVPAVQEENVAMATVDVDLSQPQAVVSQPAQADKKFIPKAEKPNRNSVASVVIPVSSGGRLDPFFPFNEAKVLSNQPKFDIVAPPMEIPETDPQIDRLMEVKVTGIMFDSVRPSAIIVIDGNEQLVHKGDLVYDYKILNITKDKVVMKYKTNIYEVTAGQAFASDGVNLNPVSSSSLSNQFGGAYSGKSKNTIQFN